MNELDPQIERLLAEPVAAAAERERTSFAEALSRSDGTVVLFGAGRLGQLCARALRRAGVPLRAFCDGNEALHGMIREGVAVTDPAEAAQRFGPESLFVVAIWTGTARESMVERIAWLQGLGCRQIVTYAPLLWAHGRDEVPFHSFDLPTRTLANAEEIRRLANMLGDDESQRVLLAALRQRLCSEFDDRAPAADQYFPGDLVRLRNDEVMVDGGAFDGDTLATFLARTQHAFSEYHAFEPDPINLGRLRELTTALPAASHRRIHIYPIALHDREAKLSFASHGAQTSQVTASGEGRVLGRPLDFVLEGRCVTFLKLDVEGAELTALNGAKQLLRRHRPLVAACVYHGATDLWEIPLLLQDWLPESRLFLRQHAFDGWEMVCYAIPPLRCVTDDK